MTKQISFIPKDNGEIEIKVIEVKPKPEKEIQLCLLEWAKLEGWKKAKGKGGKQKNEQLSYNKAE